MASIIENIFPWLPELLLPYREDLNEGAELAHKFRQVPSLHQRRPELEGDAEGGQQHVGQRQVSDVEVCHGLGWL